MILVIEDNESVRTLVGVWLELRGEKVLLASSGQEGLELFRSKKTEITIVFLDHTLPDMTGRAVLEHIRSESENVMVIISSGHDLEELSESLSDLEVSAYLHKPFLRDDLDQVMDQITSQ